MRQRFDYPAFRGRAYGVKGTVVYGGDQGQKERAYLRREGGTTGVCEC